MSRVESASEVAGSSAGAPSRIASACEELQRQVEDLGESHAGLAARVRRHDRDEHRVPTALRRALADFSRELDDVRAELDRLGRAAGDPIFELAP